MNKNTKEAWKDANVRLRAQGEKRKEGIHEGKGGGAGCAFRTNEKNT